MSTNTIRLIYKLDGIDADDGVDIFEVAPILMEFGNLVKAANAVLEYDQKLDVRVKPFKEGSWITEFVFQSTVVQNLLTYLKSSEGTDLLLLMAFLGLSVKDGISGVPEIVRRTKGFVSRFKKNEDSTVTYETPDGGTFTVTLPEHRLVQSPLIQVSYYNSLIVPLDKFPTATSVEISDVLLDNKPQSDRPQRFTREDKESFETYRNTELLEDVEDNITRMDGIFLKPKRGSYSGTEQAYSFIMGDNNVLWPVTIGDNHFLNKLKSGEIRLFAEDVLKVNLEVKQRKDAANRIQTSYAIIHVLEYIKYEKPRQFRLEDYSP